MAKRSASYELFGERVDFSRFSELETRIVQMVEAYGRLKQQKEELQQLLEVREAELEEANTIIRGLHEERDSVRAKVDSLLDMLQEGEK